MSSPKKTRSTLKTASDKQGLGSAVSDPGVSADSDLFVSPSIIAAIERSVASALHNNQLIDRIVSGLVDEVSARVIDSLTAALDAANNKIQDLSSEVESLKLQLADRNLELSGRIDDLEQHQRRNNLRFYGVPELPDEDTSAVVVDILQKKMGMVIDAELIDTSHRVGGKREAERSGAEPRPRPILVRFTHHYHRRRSFSGKRQLKGTGIVIREDLTRQRMEVYLKAKERYGLNKVWTLDGVIHWIAPDGKRGSSTSTSSM
jgi:hypothetical protein